MDNHDEKTRRFKPQFPGQHNNEEIELVFRQHLVVARKPFLYGIIILLVAIIPLTFEWTYTISWLPSLFQNIFYTLGIIVFIAWVFAWAGWHYSVYILTDRRLVAIKQKGLFDRSVQEWQLDKIYNVNYRIGGFQATLFGFGDISIKTAIGEFVMEKIFHPVDVHQKILTAVKEIGTADAGSFIDNSVSMM